MAFLPAPPLPKLRCRHPAARHVTMVDAARPAAAAPAFAPGVLSLENEGAYAVMAAAAALEARTGKSVVHLEIGQPGFATPEPIADAGVAAIRAGHTKYSAPPGIADLRSAIADYVRAERGLADVTAANIVVGPGAKPGLFFTALALVRGAGDRVVIPDPGFPTYRAMVDVAGGTVVPVRLRPDQRSFDMDALRAAVDARTRLLVLNSPGNPTGGVMPAEDLREIARLAREHDFWVLSDEIYSQLVYDGAYESVAALPGMAARTVVVDGFSKSFAMTGWRLGWAVMPEPLARRVELLLVHAVGCTATFVQHAGVAALRTARDGAVDAMRAAYRRRRDIVVDGLNAIDGVSCNAPQGAFYAWADVSSFGRSSKEVADFLLNEGLVATLPGTDFGEGGEGFIRLSYVAEEDQLREGLRRLSDAFDRLSPRS